MSKEEIKHEINKVLESFSDAALEELLAFLKELDAKRDDTNFLSPFNKILEEDSNLLSRLAQ